MAATAAALAPPDAEGCAIDLRAQFTFIYQPHDLEAQVEHGRLGIIWRSFNYRYLVLAYRYFSGSPLTVGQRNAVYRSTSQGQLGNFAYDPSQEWLTARKAVPGMNQLWQINAFKTHMDNTRYVGYWNCLPDAFHTAAATLAERMVKWGQNDSRFMEWIRGQDQVFSNCSGEPSIPDELPPDADRLLVSDRAYQIAAAQLYAEEYDEADASFRRIAADRSSPWSTIAPYLVARTMIRKASVGEDKGAFQRAESQLDSILKNPGDKTLHESAAGLLGYVRSRSNPSGRVLELERVLLAPNAGAQFEQTLNQYTYLLNTRSAVIADLKSKSDLTAWIFAFRNADGAAVQRWRKDHTLPWFIASLANVTPKDPAVPDLITAARALAKNSPAYETAAYYGIRLEIQRGELSAARSWVDAALANTNVASVRNQFRSEHMRIAGDWNEFHRYAARQPVAATVSEADEEIPPANRYYPYAEGPVFDYDAAAYFNVAAPLKRWLEAASTPILPATLRTEVAQAGWVRAVLLDRDSEAHAFAVQTRSSRSKVNEWLKEYAAEPDRAAAKFFAVLIMLREPEMGPMVPAAYDGGTPIDSFSQSRFSLWSNLLSHPTGLHNDGFAGSISDLYSGARLPSVSFLSSAERAEGETEARKLFTSVPNGVNYLCSQVLAWARARQSDPRVPEALHLAVRATRHGVRDDHSGALSKEAFDLLHTRYPNTKWAQMTKYWYK